MVSWGSSWVLGSKRKDGVGARLGNVVSRALGAQMTWLCRWRGERRRMDENTS